MNDIERASWGNSLHVDGDDDKVTVFLRIFIVIKRMFEIACSTSPWRDEDIKKLMNDKDKYKNKFDVDTTRIWEKNFRNSIFCSDWYLCFTKTRKQLFTYLMETPTFWHFRWSLTRRYISIIYVYNLPRLRISNVNKSNNRKWIHSKKGGSGRYPAETMADDLALHANTPALAESLLICLE